jgi:hypothetical protein
MLTGSIKLDPYIFNMIIQGTRKEFINAIQVREKKMIFMYAYVSQSGFRGQNPCQSYPTFRFLAPQMHVAQTLKI